MGALMLVLFVVRFFVFQLYESPKFLMGRGRDAEAVEVVHKVAEYNGTTSSITLEMLRGAERSHLASVNDGVEKTPFPTMETSRLGALRRTLRRFGWDHVTPLFKTRKLAWSTSLLIALWGTHPSSLLYFVYVLMFFCSPHWPCFPAVRRLVFLLIKFLLTWCSTRYNSFVTYLYCDDFSLAVPFLIVPCSLATRGADFGDGSTYITYRNVSILVSVASLVTHSPPNFSKSS
jgi:hypothetical protein